MNIHLQRLIAGSKAIATVLLAAAGIMVGVILLSWVIKSLPVVALLILVVLGAATFASLNVAIQLHRIEQLKK